MRFWLVFLFLISPVSQADVTVEDLEQIIEAELPEDLTEQLIPLLKKYNRDKSNKAIALGAINGGGYAAGVSYKGPSELAASNTAMQQCSGWLQTNQLQGQCEIVVLGEQAIKPGAFLRKNVTAETPAMAWKVSGPKGDLYLLGTLHILKTTLLPMPAVFDQFYLAADNVVFETNPVMQSDPARQQELVALMVGEPAEQKKLYGKKAKKVIKRFAKSQGMDVEAFYTAKPVVNALQITQLKTAAIGYSSQTGVEMHYARQASGHGKPVRELETPVESLQALFAISPELQVELLTETVTDIDEVTEGIELIVSNWLTGEAEKVYQQTREDFIAAPELATVATAMLDHRNIRWMEKIDKMLESESSSVVMVGAAHFGGENGLIALLKNRGLTPVQYTWAGAPIED